MKMLRRVYSKYYDMMMRYEIWNEMKEVTLREEKEGMGSPLARRRIDPC